MYVLNIAALLNADLVFLSALLTKTLIENNFHKIRTQLHLIQIIMLFMNLLSQVACPFRSYNLVIWRFLL